MSLRTRLLEDRGGLQLTTNVKFYAVVALGFVLTFGVVTERLHPERAAQREAIARAEKAQADAQAAAEQARWDRRNADYHTLCDNPPADYVVIKACADQTYRRTHMFGEPPGDTITIEVH
jgi:hypothetical protein